jgi:ABC-type Fe3+/spermidine/putrescine transport system ATPase subunit
VLRLEEICLNLGAFQLQNISLHVRHGEYMVLLGPTGTGKTVLLEVIAGLRFPDEGKIFLNSQDAGSLSPEARHLGVVYQDYALFPHLTVYDNIAFGLRLKNEPKVKIHNAVDEMARFLEIDDLLNRRPRHLSGGERQRVALARALVLKPHMLLLDEPLSALDRLTRDRLRRELKRIHSEIGVTVLHITHDLSEAFFLADRLVVMEEGAVVQEGSPQEILKHPVNLFVAELLGIENFIPASVGDEGKALITNLGPMDSGLFFTKPFTEQKRIYLTIPAWAVELFPDEDNGAYLWRGKMRVANLNHANGHIEIELEHESGERLRTTLSRREAASLPVPLAVGTEMATGLLREGLHWVPKRSDS